MAKYRIFVVDNSGERKESDVSDISNFKDEEVYLVVDDHGRKIYIWKGQKAPVRKKFISARTAQTLRMELGMTYKIVSIEVGTETNEFKVLMGMDTKAIVRDPNADLVQAGPTMHVGQGKSAATGPRPTPQPKPKPAGTASRPKSKPQPKPKPAGTASRPKSKPQPKPQPETKPKPQPKPQPETKSKPQPKPQQKPKPDLKATSKQASAAEPKIERSKVKPKVERPIEEDKPVYESTTAGMLTTKEISTEKLLEKMQEIKVPSGFQREIVIVGNTVFSVEKTYNKLFKRETLRLEPMNDLPSGVFPASEYQTRLFIEEGKVLFVELLSEVAMDERDEFISDMRSSLKDLTRLGI